LDEVLQRDTEITPSLVGDMFPRCDSSVSSAFTRIGNPRHALERMHELIGGICSDLEHLSADFEAEASQDRTESNASEEPPLASAVEGAPKGLYLNETFSLMLDRWEKLNKDFKNKKTGMYDLTKVPDVYDMVRYDVLHNAHIGLAGIEELLTLARDFADVVVPQEYGISKEEKIAIGAKMCGESSKLINQPCFCLEM
jgi:inositol hexakisphosphate/diphosphoinositol-pentakisphosphate kinase